MAKGKDGEGEEQLGMRNIPPQSYVMTHLCKWYIPFLWAWDLFPKFAQCLGDGKFLWTFFVSLIVEIIYIYDKIFHLTIFKHTVQ